MEKRDFKETVALDWEKENKEPEVGLRGRKKQVVLKKRERIDGKRKEILEQNAVSQREQKKTNMNKKNLFFYLQQQQLSKQIRKQWSE